MKYKLVVFDLDGTLVNSLEDLAIAVNYGLKNANLPLHDVEKYKTFVGNGRDKLIERAMGEMSSNPALKEQVKASFDLYYAKHCNDNTASYPGCFEMLKRLSEQNVMTAVLSNKPDEFVDEILSKIYPNHFFTLAWGRKPEYKEKPNPESLRAMLEELGVSAEECLYIGDSDVDVFTAQNAGVDMLGVEWGFRGREELISAGAPKVVSTAAEIVEYINEH